MSKKSQYTVASMTSSKKIENIEVWRLSRDFNKKLYWLIRDIKELEQKFISQILSSAGSIMDNIAEGYERDGNKELIQFLSISKGSCGECKSQVYRLFDRGKINEETFIELLKDLELISKQLSGFINYLKNSNQKGIKYK